MGGLNVKIMLTTNVRNNQLGPGLPAAGGGWGRAGGPEGDSLQRHLPPPLQELHFMERHGGICPALSPSCRPLRGPRSETG